MKILIIEDDKTINKFIAQGLREEGYSVASAVDGKKGLDLALAETFDLLVLDLMLPSLDGLSICRTLRQHKLSIPILMLTAKDTVENRIEGLDGGADDYLVKPFAFTELLARIRALLRRNPAEVKTLLSVGELSMDMVKHRVMFKGKELELTSREFELLQHLMKRKGHVLSRTIIIESVWGYDFHAGTNVIDVYINFLRRKLRQLTGKEWIRTLRNRGYVFEEPVD